MHVDVNALITKLQAQGVACPRAQALSSSVLTQLTLSGGGKLGVYDSRHARP